jgi:hypothetical protein
VAFSGFYKRISHEIYTIQDPQLQDGATVLATLPVNSPYTITGAGAVRANPDESAR